LYGFSGLFAQNGGFWGGKIGEGVVDPNALVLTYGLLLCATFGKNLYKMPP